MSSKLKLKNINGNTLTLENKDTNLVDKSVDLGKITTYVDTVEDLASIETSAECVIVRDKDRGGVFNAIGSTTANDGTIFDGSGCSWERQYSGAVNVKWFGAKGDWDKDTKIGFDNKEVLQKIIDVGFKDIFAPNGVYYSSVSIKLPHTGSYYGNDTGITIRGDSNFTVLTRGDDVNTGEVGEEFWPQRAFFANYGSYNRISNCRFEDCPIGIYSGQDDNELTEGSSTSFNEFKDLVFQDCGTGVMSAASTGHYYNSYQNIHLVQCQYGMLFINHSRSVPLDNNNRNTFTNVRTARCKVGFYLKKGDTNDMFGVHGEGCGLSATNNHYPNPDTGRFSMPVGITNSAQIIEGSNNNFYGCIMESNDFNLYNSGVNNEFFGCLYRADDEPTKIKFDTKPKTWIERNTLWLENGSFQSFSNVIAEFGNKVGVTIKNTTTPINIEGEIKQTADDIEYSSSSSKTFELGSLSSGSTVAFDLWVDDVASTSSSAIIDVSIVAPSVVSNLAFSKNFKVLAMRNASRTLIRYYLFDAVDARATGLGFGDSAETINAVLSVDTKDLVCTLAPPIGRDFTNVLVTIKINETK